MRSRCHVWCYQSCGDVQLSIRNVWQCVHCLFADRTKYNKFIADWFSWKKSRKKLNLEPIFIEDPVPNACNPSPCGPNSQCRDVNSQAICSCLPGYLGETPYCKPECLSASDCPLTRTCVNQKCVDPCAGACGLHANCKVINHNAVCYCSPRYTGDPFNRCRPVAIGIEASRSGEEMNHILLKSWSKALTLAHLSSFLLILPTWKPWTFQTAAPPPTEYHDEPESPCVPTPCGLNSKCVVSNGSPSCSCLPNYKGIPPYCRPECTTNSDCPNRLACINERCSDPCVNACGDDAQCSVALHVPNCYCIEGTAGNPFVACRSKVLYGDCKFASNNSKKFNG